jgi:hypothetical protein
LVTIRVALKSQGYSRKREPHLALRRRWHGRPEPLAATPHKRRAPGMSKNNAGSTTGQWAGDYRRSSDARFFDLFSRKGSLVGRR